MNKLLDHRDFHIVPQQFVIGCGPACLHAVYRHWGKSNLPIERISREIQTFENGGTFSVRLGIHALKNGYKATMHSYNLRVFDPTWEEFDPITIARKLRERAAFVSEPKTKENIASYIEFLELGGQVAFAELTTKLLQELLEKRNPIIVGLSATHLYRSPRVTRNGDDDDVEGDPQGHFVIILGVDDTTDKVWVADPFQEHPLHDELIYAIDSQRLINAIMLGILTYDANLLQISPKQK